MIEELKAKIYAAAGEVLSHHREVKKVLDKKDDEVKALKISIKNGTSENARVDNELKILKKTLKAKEKYIYDLENFKLNSQEKLKISKRNATELKSEKIKLERQVKLQDKKIEDLKKNNSTLEMNNNNLESKISSVPTSRSIKVSGPCSDVFLEKDLPKENDSSSTILRTHRKKSQKQL